MVKWAWCFFLSSGFLWADNGSLTSLSESKVEKKQIVICGHPDYPPVSWVEEGDTSTIVGLAPTIAERIFNKLHYEVQAKNVGNWKRCLRELALGNVDLAVAYRTQRREVMFEFSTESVIDDPVAIFVNRSRVFQFENWNDLRGKTVGLMLGDSNGDAFDRFMKRNLMAERVSEGHQNFGKLERGHIDFIPYGLHSGNLLIQRLGLEEKIMPLPKSLTTNYYYLAVSKKSELIQHMDFIDNELKRMHSEGEIKRLTAYFIDLYLSQLPLLKESISKSSPKRPFSKGGSSNVLFTMEGM